MIEILDEDEGRHMHKCKDNSNQKQHMDLVGAMKVNSRESEEADEYTYRQKRLSGKSKIKDS